MLPNELRKLIKGSLVDTSGDSGAITYRVEPGMYLKISDDRELEREKDILLWLQGKLLVPEVLYYGENEYGLYLLTSEVVGVDASQSQARPEEIVRLLAEGLQMIHSLQGCPFERRLDTVLERASDRVQRGLVREGDFEDQYQGISIKDLYQRLSLRPTEDLVFVHGDYCLPNIILNEGKVSGFIDLGRAGVADRYTDLALCIRSIRYNLKEDYVDLFVEYYGIDLDWEKVQYYILLDEFF